LPAPSVADPPAKRRSGKAEHVAVLTPVKNARDALPRYLELLETLDGGGRELSIAFLEGDSTDGSHQALALALPSLAGRFLRAELHRRHEGLQFEGPRWTPALQRRRRAVIARARNALIDQALGDADWALWLDADLIDYPPDLLTRLIGAERPIVVPHCVTPDGAPFDLNTFLFDPGLFDPAQGGRDDPAHLADGLFQPPRGAGRLYLDAVADQALARVDSVGGTALLVRADLHRGGLRFPEEPYRGYIETEGLAMMAKDRGVDCWALPGLRIVHPAGGPDPAQPRPAETVPE
jgi:hypothetical protein